MLNKLVHYMNYLQTGLAVHTNNLENSVVPGSQARELKPFKEQVKTGHTGKINRTHQHHLIPKKMAASGNFETQKNTSTTSSLSGSTINREEELAKIGGYTTEYYQATRLYQKSMGLVRNFLGIRT